MREHVRQLVIGQLEAASVRQRKPSHLIRDRSDESTCKLQARQNQNVAWVGMCVHGLADSVDTGHSWGWLHCNVSLRFVL